jgi:hypothetical protein
MIIMNNLTLDMNKIFNMVFLCRDMLDQYGNEYLIFSIEDLLMF